MEMLFSGRANKNVVYIWRPRLFFVAIRHEYAEDNIYRGKRCKLMDFAKRTEGRKKKVTFTRKQKQGYTPTWKLHSFEL